MFDNIQAIGFDLFNTLITMEVIALDDALGRLTASLKEDGIVVDHHRFVQSYRSAVSNFLEKARQDGKEGHNRFWISEALKDLGYKVSPDDPHISTAVDRYFSAFTEHVTLIPETIEMLDRVRDQYRIGLLSNFTHSPAAMEIIAELGLTPYFEVILISGDLGYRKPHPSVFTELVEGLGIRRDQIAYVGDDPQADVFGALLSGVQPIWTTYVQDHNISPAPGMLSLPPEDPLPEVPTISGWGDLFPLLGQDGA